jgi:phosphoesterase RecJ-like protein
MDNLNESWFKEPFLGIIVDTANQSRIADPRFKKAKFKIKIDHHPAVDNYGNVQVVDTTTAAAAELVCALLLNAKGKYVLSKEAATWFHMGIVGDSGSFRYSSVSPLTFSIASQLAGAGVEISKLVQNMFLKQIDDLKVTAYILNNFKISPKGVAYYVLDKNIQEELKITTERGKENVNLFANIEGIPAWCSITEDPKDQCWRVSIRSKLVPINGVAAMFEGGGHAQASGAKLNSLDDLDRFIGELDKLF